MGVLKQRSDQCPLLIRQIRWVRFVRHRASSWIPLRSLPDQQSINLKPHASPSLKFNTSSTQLPLGCLADLAVVGIQRQLPAAQMAYILCPRKNPKIQEPCKNKAIRCTGAKDQLKNARRNKKRLGFNLPPPSLCFFGFSNGLSI